MQVIVIATHDPERDNPAWLDLDGAPVFAWAIDTLERVDVVSGMTLVLAPERVAEAHALGALHGWQRTHIVASGPEWHKSLLAGLHAVTDSCRWIGIHEGNRPLITTRLIRTALAAARQSGASALGEPVKDTIKRVAGNTIVETPPRGELAQLQTPQIFERAWLQEASETFPQGRGGGHEAVYAFEAGISVQVVPASADNMKVLSADDLPLAHHLLKQHDRSVP